MDPIPRTLEVLRLESDLWVVARVFTGDSRVRAEPFDSVELDLGAVRRGTLERAEALVRVVFDLE
jgi:hypothetical protein